MFVFDFRKFSAESIRDMPVPLQAAAGRELAGYLDSDMHGPMDRQLAQLVEFVEQLPAKRQNLGNTTG